MDKTINQKLDVSVILISMLSIAFLLYVSWMLCHIGAYLRVVAVYSLMMPNFISIWRALKRCGGITQTEQWVFIILAIILWLIQSSLTGKLHNLVS
jgi:hypothetical protein